MSQTWNRNVKNGPPTWLQIQYFGSFGSMSSYHDAPVATSGTGMVPSGILAPVSALPVGITVAAFDGLLVGISGVGYVPLGVTGALLDTGYSTDEGKALEVLDIKARVRSMLSRYVYYVLSIILFVCCDVLQPVIFSYLST